MFEVSQAASRANCIAVCIPNLIEGRSPRAGRVGFRAVVVLVEAGHDAEVGPALRAVVLGFSAKFFIVLNKK